MVKRRSAEKEEFWRLVIQEQRDSGLTIKAFCQQQGLSSPSFYAWKRVIKLRDAEASNDAVGQAGRMVPIQVIDDQTPRLQRSLNAMKNGSDDTIEIASPSGFVFHFGAGVSATRLGDVVAAVDQRGRHTC